MAAETELHQAVRRAKTLQRVFLVAIAGYLIVLVQITPLFRNPILEGPALLYSVIGAAILSVANIATGFYLQRYTVSRPAPSRQSRVQVLLKAHIVRLVFFDAVAVYGLLLGLVNSRWEIGVPFFVVAAALLIVSLPSEESWRRALEVDPYYPR